MRIPSNAAVLASLEARRLRNEHSIPEMRHLLSLLGHAAHHLDRLNVVHIAGSKGKGSTAAFVESIMRQHGLRTALFTSPHLVHPRERLRLDGLSMKLERFSSAVVNVYNRLVGRAEALPGLFRFMTLLAYDQMLEAHARGELDVAIVECGMGGRYDSTNVVERPAVTAITSLAMEHVRALGPTMADIAHHKVGIAKRGVPLLSVPQPIEAVNVICDCSRGSGAPLQFVRDLKMELPPFNTDDLGIEGEPQRLNAALAVRICKVWWEQLQPGVRLNPQLIAKGLRSTRWPGRHQIYRTAQQTWYLDGAHTVESIQYALDWFRGHRDAEQERLLVFHVSHERSFEKLLDPIIALQLDDSLFQGAYFVKPASPTDTPEEAADLSLHRQMAAYWTSRTGTAGTPCLAGRLTEHLPDRRVQILTTGSLYLVGDMMRVLGVSIS